MAHSSPGRWPVGRKRSEIYRLDRVWRRMMAPVFTRGRPHTAPSARRMAMGSHTGLVSPMTGLEASLQGGVFFDYTAGTREGGGPDAVRSPRASRGFNRLPAFHRALGLAAPTMVWSSSRPFRLLHLREDGLFPQHLPVLPAMRAPHVQEKMSCPSERRHVPLTIREPALGNWLVLAHAGLV